MAVIVLHFILLLSFSSVLESSPVSSVRMMDYYKQLFTDENCMFPQALHIPEELNSSLSMPLKICQNITNSKDDAERYEFLLCEEVFHVLQIILCEQEKLSSDIPKNSIITLLPKGNVCLKFQEWAAIPESYEMYNKLKENSSCEMMCKKNVELCQFLLWLYKARSELASKITALSSVASVSVVPTNTNNTIAPDEGKSEIKVNASNTFRLNTLKEAGTQSESVSYMDSTVTPGRDATTGSLNKSSVVVTQTGQVQHTSNAANNEIKSKKVTELDKTTINSLTPKKNSENSLGNKTTPVVKVTSVQTLAHDSSVPVKTSVHTSVAFTTYPVPLENIEGLDDKIIEPSLDDNTQDYNTDIANKLATGENTIKKPNSNNYDTSFENDGDSIIPTSIGQPLFPINSAGGFDKTGAYMEADNPHFFLYFLFIVGIIIGCYVLFHNKQKIYFRR